MKVQYYTINVKSKNDSLGRRLVILAINKKEAMKFCKDFEGIKVLERCKGKSLRSEFDNINYLMSAQKELLTQKLKANELYIEN